MENLIENYNKAKQALYDHVGFKEDWVICPIDDCTDEYWDVVGLTVKYADSQEEFIGEKGNYYTDDLYTQRFYNKWVYMGTDYTMVFCDPHVDGMKWFRVFDNKKRMNKN